MTGQYHNMNSRKQELTDWTTKQQNEAANLKKKQTTTQSTKQHQHRTNK